MRRCGPAELMKRICFGIGICGLALAIGGLSLNAAPGETNAVRRLSVDEFEKLWQAKTNVVLDVRTEKEFKGGHIPGAVNLDFNAPDFQKKVAELDKSKTYLVHCAGGVRSGKACAIMDKTAFPNVVNLEPGFKAWEKAGKPVEKK